MDPFVFAIILAFMVCKGPVEDLAFAARGKESPRLRHRRVVGPSAAAKLGHATADRLAHTIAPKPSKPRPARQYWRDLWEDSWNAATDKRRDKRTSEPVSPVGVPPEGETVAPPTGGAWGRHMPPPYAEPVSPTGKVPPAAGPRPGARRTGTPRPASSGEVPPAPQPGPGARPGASTPPPPGSNGTRSSSLPFQTEGPPARPPVVHANAERTDKPAVETDAPARVDNSDHTVIDGEVVDTTAPIPVPSPLTLTGGSTMTDIADTATADTGTMNAAIAYADRMLGSVADSMTALDTTASGLERDNWTGDAVDGLREAIGHFTGIQSQLEAARTSLEEARPVQDAYTAAPHVGSRESVLAE